MSATPALARYRGLLLALIVVFAVLTLLAIPAMIALGRWTVAVVAAMSLLASMLLYTLVKDYSE